MGQGWFAARTEALGAADLGMELDFLEEVAINPIIELPELTQDWEIDWEAQQNLVHQDPEKGAVTPEETAPDLPVGVRQSPVEAWVRGGLLQGWGH